LAARRATRSLPACGRVYQARGAVLPAAPGWSSRRAHPRARTVPGSLRAACGGTRPHRRRAGWGWG